MKVEIDNWAIIDALEKADLSIPEVYSLLIAIKNKLPDFSKRTAITPEENMLYAQMKYSLDDIMQKLDVVAANGELEWLKCRLEMRTTDNDTIKF